MTIPPISPVAPTPLPQVNAPAAASSSDRSFGEMIGEALDSVSSAHSAADDLAVQAATGDLTAVHDYTIAATEAQLLTQLTVEVRNRAVEAFNDIMRMQV
ncbi:MAG: flagellar hook-basal body complex protein FliE [Ilumatobacter sp.]|uniref:flagellar hook-basal body complex protein FliE n=1 Tax=Ilumatobacter sp. TaxID=1967498 RepID=UPI00262C26FE|nr:flagellar hook-basal body complex protein FliE [Ilumatobacter sp.]MDJ0767456.1 flagellar hook-basal body complex protein FliE [Ilumatobacter sp.]